MFMPVGVIESSNFSVVAMPEVPMSGMEQAVRKVECRFPAISQQASSHQFNHLPHRVAAMPRTQMVAPFHLIACRSVKTTK
jgi:hypothetical protein